MKLLLDTHTFLWFVDGSSELSTSAQSLLEDINNQLFMSVGSIWEMAIKISLGKLTVPLPYENFIARQLSVNDITLLKHLNRPYSGTNKLTFSPPRPI